MNARTANIAGARQILSAQRISITPNKQHPRDQALLNALRIRPAICLALSKPSIRYSLAFKKRQAD
jgi:hypothetical protein